MSNTKPSAMDMSERKFYRQRFTFDVLSEEPLEEVNLYDIAYAVDEGPCVGYHLSEVREELTPKAMADALYDAGSEPGFFQLDDDGNEVEL